MEKVSNGKDNLKLFWATERIEEIKNKLRYADQKELITRRKMRSMTEQMKIEITKTKEVISLGVINVENKVTDMVGMMKNSWRKILVTLVKSDEKKRAENSDRDKLKERPKFKKELEKQEVLGRYIEELKMNSEELLVEGKKR
jgi:hypothetical protein